MADYAELYELSKNTELRNKVTVAVTKKAQSLIEGGTPTAGQIAWADSAISNPSAKAAHLLNYVLAANSGLDVVEILAATDAAIQSNVNTAVDALITGGA